MAFMAGIGKAQMGAREARTLPTKDELSLICSLCILWMRQHAQRHLQYMGAVSRLGNVDHQIFQDWVRVLAMAADRAKARSSSI